MTEQPDPPPLYELRLAHERALKAFEQPAAEDRLRLFEEVRTAERAYIEGAIQALAYTSADNLRNMLRDSALNRSNRFIKLLRMEISLRELANIEARGRAL